MKPSCLAIALAGVLIAAQAAAFNDIRGALPYRMWRTHAAKTLEQSKSPRDWALASQLMNGDEFELTAERAALLGKAAQSAPGDLLVQWMWAHAGMQTGACHAEPVCTDRFNALAKLEPDNAAAWLPAANQAWAAQDPAALEAALAHMAAAKRFDQPLGVAVAAWMDIFKRIPPPSLAVLKGMAPSGESGTPANLAFDEAGDTALASRSGLVWTCMRKKNPKASAAHFVPCGDIGRLMLQHATNLGDRAAGMNILRASGMAKPADVPAMRNVGWMLTQFEKIQPAMNAARESTFLADIVATGDEVVAIGKQLRQSGIAPEPPPSWQWIRDGKPVDLLAAP